MKVINLSHYDVDAIGCVICIWNSIKHIKNIEFEYMMTTYGEPLNKRIKSLYKEDIDILFITDLNFTEDQVDMLKNIKARKIVYLDHHTYAYDIQTKLNEMNIINVISKEYCATKLTMEYLEDIKGDSADIWGYAGLVDFVDAVDIYDRWQTQSPDFKINAMALNDLFWEYGYEKFFKKFRIKYQFDVEDRITINDISTLREKSISTIFDKRVENPYSKFIILFTFNKKFINDFTIFYPNYNIYLMMHTFEDNQYKYSIRINNKCDVTVQQLNELLGDITERFGGHDKAGGIAIKQEMNEKFLEKMNEITEELCGPINT